MILSTEGVSGAGKTSTVEYAIDELGLDAVFFRGESMKEHPSQKDWDSYLFTLYRTMQQMNEQNPSKTFIADRLYSEAVYPRDEQTRLRHRRALQTVPEAKVVLFTATEETLKERNSDDIGRIQELQDNYMEIPCDLVLNSEASSTQECAERLVNAIEEWTTDS